MAASGEVLFDFFADPRWYRKRAGFDRKVTKPVDVVLSTKARGLHGLLDVEAKHNSVQCNLNRSLVLLVAAGTKHKPSSGSFAAAVERQCKGVDLKCAAADATNFP